MKKTAIFFSALIIGFCILQKPVLAEAPIDADGDGLDDLEETTIYQTDPSKPDTDGDGFSDGEEIKNGYSPISDRKVKLSEMDTDADGLNDAVEIALKTNLANPDTDGDGYKDGSEVFTGFNPLKGGRDRTVERSVHVNLTNQTMDYLFNGVKVGSMLVSTGRLNAKTPVGTFAIQRKVPVKFYRGLTRDFPNTKWNLQFKPSYYIHGAYWHNEFGKTPVSGGCVNLAYPDAEKMYRFLDVGDKVVVSGKTPARVTSK